MPLSSRTRIICLCTLYPRQDHDCWDDHLCICNSGPNCGTNCGCISGCIDYYVLIVVYIINYCSLLINLNAQSHISKIIHSAPCLCGGYNMVSIITPSPVKKTLPSLKRLNPKLVHQQPHKNKTRQSIEHIKIAYDIPIGAPGYCGEYWGMECYGHCQGYGWGRGILFCAL